MPAHFEYQALTKSMLIHPKLTKQQVMNRVQKFSFLFDHTAMPIVFKCMDDTNKHFGKKLIQWTTISG